MLSLLTIFNTVYSIYNSLSISAGKSIIERDFYNNNNNNNNKQVVFSLFSLCKSLQKNKYIELIYISNIVTHLC